MIISLCFVWFVLDNNEIFNYILCGDYDRIFHLAIVRDLLDTSHQQPLSQVKAAVAENVKKIITQTDKQTVEW